MVRGQTLSNQSTKFVIACEMYIPKAVVQTSTPSLRSNLRAKQKDW